jgi:hypothetical protein
MTSNFSNDSAQASDAIFKKHHVIDIVGSLAESKQLADGYTNVHKWQHRAHVLVVGDPTIRPYYPIYLDGLPNGMSGYWTVISAVHRFGSSLASYLVELEVGTDLLGDSNPDAIANADTRDIQAEIAGQALIANDTVLLDVSFSPNATSLISSSGSTAVTAVTNTSAISVPSVPGSTPYLGQAPNNSNVKLVTRFVSKKNGTLII